ncbi:hypothetical protein SBRY_110070 [Actinacidiphila bryophytorum]|uniref:Uncharacterized protein n=1 Tax=Actinacidiphila bryophytorum TaxID=1436133 RepID=A0A9W4E3R9_9ACTN|nr:hypothetical protein SBRY_110070 [Actinacidiphila bryophytorum]
MPSRRSMTSVRRLAGTHRSKPIPLSFWRSRPPRLQPTAGGFRRMEHFLGSSAGGARARAGGISRLIYRNQRNSLRIPAGGGAVKRNRPWRERPRGVRA